MAQRFDLIVIGTGTAARVAAMRCRAAGWTIVVIECKPFGGARQLLSGCRQTPLLRGVTMAGPGALLYAAYKSGL